jgi:hypothetical protein
MQIEVSMISTNEYVIDEIIMENIPEKYLYNDQGDFSCAGTFFSSHRLVKT